MEDTTPNNSSVSISRKHPRNNVICSDDHAFPCPTHQVLLAPSLVTQPPSRSNNHRLVDDDWNTGTCPPPYKKLRISSNEGSYSFDVDAQVPVNWTDPIPAPPMVVEPIISFDCGNQSIMTQMINVQSTSPTPTSFASLPVDQNNTRVLKPSLHRHNEEAQCQQIQRRNPIRVTTSTLDVFTDNQETAALIVRLEKLLSDQDQYRQLLSCPKASAQRFLDMFQKLLDSPDTLGSKFRNDLIVATQRLAGNSGLYPMSFELRNLIGVGDTECYGASADIYKGTLQDQIVCLKTIRFHQNTEKQSFLKACSKEAILWSQLSHHNLLPFYGIYRFRNRLSLVSPWMDHGDINQYLRDHPFANRVQLVSDVAQGLCFLHDNGIVHGDLKGPNVLVDKLGRAVVADFGLSSISDPDITSWTSQSSVASKGGSVRWQAPELFDPDNDEDIYNTTFSDVYAWACVTYEAFVGSVPFSHVARDTTVSFKVRNGERPARPLESTSSWTTWGLTEGIWALMQDGWKREPASRPTCREIIGRLGSTTLSPINNIQTDARYNVPSPVRFREMMGMELDLSVQTLETLLNAGQVTSQGHDAGR